MMRLASVSEATEVLQDIHSNVAGFLRMKLHSEEMVALHRSGEWFFIGAGRDRVGAQRRAIGVGEINVRSRRDSRQQPRARRDLDTVPSHVRRLHVLGESS